MLANHSPEREKEEGRACDCAALLVVACLKERECYSPPAGQPGSYSVIQANFLRWNKLDTECVRLKDR